MQSSSFRRIIKTRPMRRYLSDFLKRHREAVDLRALTQGAILDSPNTPLIISNRMMGFLPTAQS